MATGIPVNEQNNSVNAYPNPASNACTLNFNLAAAQTVSVSMVDFSGRTISVSTLDGKQGGNTTQIDLTGLTPGVYFIRLNGSTFLGCYKIVVE